MQIRHVATMFLQKLIWEEFHISYDELLAACLFHACF